MGSASQSTSGNNARAADALGDLTRRGAVRRGAAGISVRPDRVVRTGVSALDAVLPGGGLPCGYVTELAGPPSCGKLGLTARALAGALRSGERAALVDVAGVFFPLSPDLVLALSGLLVCRVPAARDAIAAAELLAASGGLAIVALDLASTRALDGPAHAALARLERAAREGQTAVVAVTQPPPGAEGLLGSSAALRVEVSAAARWIQPARIASHLRVARSRFGRPGDAAAER